MSTSDIFAELAVPDAQLVFEPFSILANRTATDPLRQSAMAMFQDQWQEWQIRACGESLGFYLRDRFWLRDWTLERIYKEWEAFVAEENLEEPGKNGSTSQTIRRGWLALTPDQSQIVGEIELVHFPHTPQKAEPFIYLRRDYRRQGLADQQINAFCQLAARAGYDELEVGFYTSQKASGALLNKLEQHGLAEFLYNTRQSGIIRGKKYRVTLAPFKIA
jgi:GNAT superfamily N-acetyltransferase